MKNHAAPGFAVGADPATQSRHGSPVPGRQQMRIVLDRDNARPRARLEPRPGGGAKMVPGKMHRKVNMYLAVCRAAENKVRFDVVEKYPMSDPKEC